MTTRIVQNPTSAIAEAFHLAYESQLESDSLAHRIAGGEKVEPAEISRICAAVRWSEEQLLDEVARHRKVHQAFEYIEAEKAARRRLAELRAQGKEIRKRLAEAYSKASADATGMDAECSRAIDAIRAAERARQRLRDDLLPELARAEIDAMRDPLSDLVMQERQWERTAKRMRIPIVADPLIANAQTTAKVREDYRKFIAAKNEDREETLAGVEQCIADSTAKRKVFCDRRDVLMAIYSGPTA